MGEQVENHRDADAIHRILVLAHEGLGGRHLIEKLDRRQAGRGSEVFVVVPALSGSLKQLISELGAPRRTVFGLVGDSDPRLALEDSLRQFAADEIIVVNPAESEMEHLEETSTARALEDVSLPVSVLTVPSDG